MENSEQKKKVRFRCKEIKSISCSKMNQARLSGFKTHINIRKGFQLKVHKKRRSESDKKEEDIEKPKLSSERSQKNSPSENSFTGDDDSKVTEKPDKRKTKNIKLTLAKLQERQQKMIELLQQLVGQKNMIILNNIHEQCEQKAVDIEKFHDQMKNITQKIRYKRLNISHAYQQKIENTGNKENKQICFERSFMKSKRTITLQNDSQQDQNKSTVKLPLFLQQLLIQAFGNNINLEASINFKKNIKKLFSYRFFAHKWTYSTFLQSMLDRDEYTIEKQQLKTVLENPPFSISEYGFLKIFQTIFQTQYDEGLGQIKIQKVVKTLRKYIEDFPVMSHFERSKQKNQLQIFFTNKRQELYRKIKQKTLQQTIQIEHFSEILKSFRLREEQIILLLSNVSLFSENLAQIQYDEIFAEDWIKNLI